MAIGQKSTFDMAPAPNVDAPSLAVADYPACKVWFRMLEGTKTNTTVLQDHIGTVTGLTVAENGTGNADANPEALTTSSSSGNEVYTTGGSIFTVGSNSIIIEADVNLSVSAVSGASVVQNGDPNNNFDGWAVIYNNSNGAINFSVRNSAKNGAVSTTLNSSPNVLNSRHHICIVWDRNVADPGSITYYVDGSLQGTFALSGAVGTGVDPDSGAFSVGYRQSNGRIADGIFYNIRVWSLSAIPSNIALVVAQMARNPNEFPSLMQGVS